MERAAELVILVLPLFVVVLLGGLGATIAVLANEGRGRSAALSRWIGALNLLLAGLLLLLAASETGAEVRGMFAFAALVFGLIALLGLRAPARFQD